MNAQEYYQLFIQTIGAIPAIARSEVTFNEIDENECYLKAILTFATEDSLHIAEYVVTRGESIHRLKYRYQLLDRAHRHIVRWDNAPHHRGLENFPHHYHDASEQTHGSSAVTYLEAILLSLEIIGGNNILE